MDRRQEKWAKQWCRVKDTRNIHKLLQRELLSRLGEKCGHRIQKDFHWMKLHLLNHKQKMKKLDYSTEDQDTNCYWLFRILLKL